MLFLPCCFVFLFFIHTTPWALSTGELLLIFQHCPQGSLHWSPPTLSKWLRHLSRAFHVTNINTFARNDLLSASPLHGSAFWAKPISSFVSRTYCGVKENDYLTTDDRNFYMNKTFTCLFIHIILLSYIATHFLELSCKTSTWAKLYKLIHIFISNLVCFKKW